ncbi:MAG: hypothetical protein M3Z08_20155 [Chloroflexota bacterium]|nr:hypothetical protein [Chloroflexota bacterium]
MLRIIIEQDSQAETHPHSQITAHLQQLPARNGGTPAVGPHYVIQSPLSLASQDTTTQHARGTAQNAGPAPRISRARRNALTA